MSQAKLTLRPPPNIEFVQGYPGIPPGAPDRPQAAVKGAIEVRVGPQGVKAKWVRIELRKVETLPGGGLANTFFDFVGQSPISVWQSSDEYSMLDTQDFPFYIRIPESLPPSIALEKGAGIKYELIATVCIKGKKGLLRRDKPSIVATASPIIIDKHELHSTWPVYSQPDNRTHSQDGVTLTVDRSHTCYGPGDRIVVMATVKPDNLHTAILRGFEFTLRETTVFRAGPHTSNRKGMAQTKVTAIGEQKVPVNVTLYGGNQHKAELTVVMPSHHTSATLNSARHIDITYVLVVKALMGTGQPVILELPVVISNWPRAVSVEATRRIGLAPNVSLPGHAMVHSTATESVSPAALALAQPIVPPQVQTISGRPSIPDMRAAGTSLGNGNGRPPVGQYNTAPMDKTNGFASTADEFGRTQEPARPATGSDHGSRDGQLSGQVLTGSHTSGGAGQSAGVARVAQIVNDSSVARPRMNSRATSTGRPLTVANFNDKDVEEATAAERQASLAASAARPPRTPPSTGQSGQSSRSQWISAEEEKRRLYETAVANVERVQGRSRSPTEYEQSSSTYRDTTSSPQSNNSSPQRTAWPTAEEEKAKLFNQAQAAVMRTQGLDSSSMSQTSSFHGRNGSYNASQSTKSPGAALYSEAMSSVRRNVSTGSAISQNSTPIQSPTPSYPSAEEEKAALRRYHEAKAAVDRTQGAAYGAAPPAPISDPISYDALYPATSPPVTATNDSPPTFVSSSSQPSYLSEKEKLRRAYETQDAAAAVTAAPRAPGFTSVNSDPPPPTPPASSAGFASPAAEKEILRRRFEAQDAAAPAAAAPPTPPPRAGSYSSPTFARGSRPPPTPPRSAPLAPGSASGSRPLTAAEEKAKLRAMYDAEEQGSRPNTASSLLKSPSTNGINGQMSTLSTPPPPPPLLPRPPKEYIQETQEEDLRTYAKLEAIDKSGSNIAGPLKTELVLSSFNAGLVDEHGNPVPAPGPPPPLPAVGKMLIE
ncbi:hypothetical protein B0H21DRAFT_11849 [Amylocystis lapponica]|nr:hypothetical protein B0H21DRAFT_11849 [Amylocystis lapponica]